VSFEPGGIGVSKFGGARMGTNSALVFIEENQLQTTLYQPQPICPEVLNAFYRAHYRYVLRICRRFFRQREDAEDAAAEVFLKLYRVLPQREEATPFRPWLSQVARHYCIDKLRQRKRERSSSLEEMNLDGVADDSIPSPLSEILRADERRLVREQLIRLPEKYKIPLVLRYYKRMSYLEIARALKMHLPTVKVTIYRAKHYLRRNLLRSE
jgi:RNA polymerase sigma-70 factor (ECF subfamily)